MTTIALPYLLIANTCPHYVTGDARRHLSALWAKDLALHLAYLPMFTVCAPTDGGDLPADAIDVADWPELAFASFIDLPEQSRSVWRTLCRLPAGLTRLWRAIRAASIVHVGVVGWPIPLGSLALLMAKLQGKFVVVIIESAPWRIPRSAKSSWVKRLRANFWEAANRNLVSLADLSIFTQEEYRDSLLTRRRERGHVIHASWINEADILSEESARGDWEHKLLPDEPTQLLFAGRLTEEKGVRVLLDAARRLNLQGCALNIDIAGDGPLRDACAICAAELTGSVRLRLVGTTRYGPEFFAMLRGYHAVLVPSLSDEQPRIVYDAYAQAIPVFASDTPGLRSCVTAGLAGFLDPSNSSEALASRIALACANKSMLYTMGLAGLRIARSLTHRAMHTKRALILAQAIDATSSSI